MSDGKVEIKQSGDGSTAIAYVENYYGVPMNKADSIRFLYKSSIVTDKLVDELMKGQRGVELDDVNHLHKSKIYRLEGDYTFRSAFDVDTGRRYANVEVIKGGVRFVADTSAENWTSKSYFNSTLKLGSVYCRGWFKILGFKGNEYVVQFLLIGDDLYD